MGDDDATDHTSFTDYHVRSGDTLASIAKQNGLTWQDLTKYNFGTDTPTEVNAALEELVGCTLRTPNGKNLVFTDKDDPGIIYIPKPDQSYDVDTGKDHPFSVPHPTFYTRIELQTVNDLGQRVGNVDLILRPDDDTQPDISLTSDDTGYGKVDKAPVGRYRVLLDDGTPAYMYDPLYDPTQPGGGAANSSTDDDDDDADPDDNADDPDNGDAQDADAPVAGAPVAQDSANGDAADADADAADAGDPDDGDPKDADDDVDAATAGDEDDDDDDDPGKDQLVEASIVTANNAHAITRIVVERVKTPEWRKQARILNHIHARTWGGVQPTEENPHPSRDSGLYSTDNLLLAAGWTSDQEINEKELVKNVLQGYLRDYQPEAIARGNYVLMVSPTLRTIRVINFMGNVEKKFKLRDDVSPHGLYGAYAVFKNVSGTMFVDMATMQYPVSVPQ